MDLLQHLVDVDGVGFLPLGPLLLLTLVSTHDLGSLAGLLGRLSRSFRRHLDVVDVFF